MPRTILVHLNVQIDDDDPSDTESVVSEIKGALDVGIDQEMTPTLWDRETDITVALAEEI
jgi:hypothetical protein